MRQYAYISFLLFCFVFPENRLLSQTLDWQTFKKQVLENHPLARQSNLLLDQANALLLRAKGGFDPKLYATYTNKNFNGKNYFEYAEAGVKLPTWAGLELKGAYNYTSGEFLNTESKLPKDGQANLGLNWSLGQGLLFDERRAERQQAAISQQMNVAERQIIQNNLLFDAAQAYWSWVLAQESLKITMEVQQQASIRHQGIVESFRQGDKPAIDTIESYIQLQTRMVDRQFARNEAQNTAIGLSVFLWDTNNQILSPEDLLQAPALRSKQVDTGIAGNLDAMVQQAQTQHPEIQVYQSKLRQLATERRLKNEKRKPIVNLSYLLLGDGWQFFPGNAANGVGVLANDIKWGLDLAYPLLNRKARGDYQLTQIKMAQTELELQQKIQVLQSKVRQYANDLVNLQQQSLLFEQITDNYRLLFDAEVAKFQQGESSIFLINTREQRWLDAQIKLLKLLSACNKTEAGLLWSIGRLAQ